MTKTLDIPALRAISSGGIAALVRLGDAASNIVLLHGIGSRASSFAGLMARWPAGPQFVAWDAPGYGGSKPLAADWPLPGDYAASLAALLDRLSIGTVDIVGHSLGCLMAAAFVRAHPQRVRRLALLSPAQGYRVPAGSTLPPAVAARITDLEKLGPKKFAAARAARLVHAPATKLGVVADVRDAMASVTLPGYAQAVRMLASGDLAADLAGYAGEIRLMTGADDQITPLAGSERLQAALISAYAGSGRDVGLDVVAHTGHAICQEAPDAVVRVLAPYFARRP